MKSINEDYFHIAGTSQGILFIERTIPLIFDSSRLNPTYSNLLVRSTYDETKKKGLINTLDGIIINMDAGRIYTHQDLKDGLYKAVPELFHLNRRYWEIIFEDIRKTRFPDLPSRMNCIYLAKREQVELWYSKVKRPDCADPAIFKFKTDGEIHFADAEWLEVDSQSLNDYKEVAINYWNGSFKDNQKREKEEILFWGKLKIEHKYSSFLEFNEMNQ